jgi:hypothetical protein
MQRRTLPHRIQKIQLSRKYRSTRFTLRKVRLDHATLFTLQLVIEIQSQPAAYVLTL